MVRQADEVRGTVRRSSCCLTERNDTRLSQIEESTLWVELIALGSCCPPSVGGGGIGSAGALAAGPRHLRGEPRTRRLQAATPIARSDVKRPAGRVGTLSRVLVRRLREGQSSDGTSHCPAPGTRCNEVVRAVGVEPTRAFSPKHFKCHASTVPPRPRRIWDIRRGAKDKSVESAPCLRAADWVERSERDVGTGVLGCAGAVVT